RAAREGASAEFVLANAQTYAFAPGAYDAIISRFGVMFFDDPIAAFANLRQAAIEHATLRFIAWRSADANPFMTTAQRAAAPFLPNLPVRQPDAPGQFAFSDGSRVHGILDASGWASIEIRPIDVECTLSETALDQYVTNFGPVGRALAEADA